MNARQIAAAVKKAHAEMGADAPLRLDLNAEENQSIQGVMDILPKGWKCISTEHKNPSFRGMTRAVFLSPKYQPPKPVTVIDVKPGEGEDVKTAIDRAEKKARTEHGTEFHFHAYTEHVFTPRPGVFHRVEVWTHESWAAHKCPCFTLAEIVSLLTETHLVISRTERRKEKGRGKGGKKGGASTSGKYKAAHLEIRREFRERKKQAPEGTPDSVIRNEIAKAHPRKRGWKIKSIRAATINK